MRRTSHGLVVVGRMHPLLRKGVHYFTPERSASFGAPLKRLTTETERLAALRGLQLLDSPQEPLFDEIVKLAATICGTPIALVTLLDADRQWFKANIGLDITEMSREQAFCSYAIEDDAPLMEVADSSLDPRFSANPLVIGEQGIRFYAGAPILGAGGEALGTICVLDRRPRELTESQRGGLVHLKRLVEGLLSLRIEVAKQRNAVEMRDRASQMLLHDVKNPLSAISANVAYLQTAEELQPHRSLIEAAGDASLGCQRCRELLETALQPSATKSAELSAAREATVNIGLLLNDLKQEYRHRAAAKAQCIQVIIDSTSTEATTDASLLRRVLENLLTNALAYSPRNTGVVLRCHVQRDGLIEVLVTDSGPGIPAGAHERVFLPGVRLDGQRGSDGHGLGLASVMLGARALGGVASVSDAEGGGAQFSVTFKAMLHDGA